MEDNIILSMSSDELASLVEQYPWFASARVELCRRTAGRDAAQYSEVAAYAGDLHILYNYAHRDDVRDLTDSEVKALIKTSPRRQVRVAGGDFFSQDEYNDVKQDGDGLLASLARSIQSGDRAEVTDADPEVAFCTEPLAEIYADQGYFAQAKYIYSQLILRYPEKSAYFASLIDKLDKLEN